MKAFLTTCLLWSSMLLMAQQDVGVIWMGFEHGWTYNHRLNRLGDYIEQPEFEGFDHPVKHVHAGATGIGRDEALFKSYYNALKSTKVGFQSGKAVLQLVDKEGQQATVSTKVTIALDDNLKDKDEMVVLLNGFDLIANRRADKMKMMSMEVTDPVLNEAGSHAEFNVKVSFIANCGSLECNRFIQKYDYTITVHYLVIAGNDYYFKTKDKSFLKSYEWDKKDNFDRGIIDETIYGAPNYPSATIGFKSIMINMDRDHWLVDWNTALHPQFYDKRTGKFDFALDLLLKQWKKKIDSPFKFTSKFSKRKDGWAYLDGTVTLLQFRNVCVEPLSRYGSVSWNGLNKDSETNEAINVHRFKVDNDCD